MVPKGWTYSTLEGLIDIKHGFAFKSEYFTNQGQFVLLTPGHFNESGGFRDQQEKTKYYNGVIPDGYLLTKGDLLLAMTEQAAGLLGSAAHIPEDNKYLHNQRLGLIKVLSPNEIDLRFLFWLYNSPEVRKQIAEQASGTKVKHTSPGKLIGVSALIPPIAEQTKIAQILSTWDKAIATTERLLANSQQQKHGLMQQLLTGQKRFAGFSEDWKHYALGQLFSERNETNHPDLSLLSITTEQGVIDRADSGKKDTSSEDKSKYRRICPGDIGYNTMRMWQGVSGLSDKEGIVSPAYTILQAAELVDSKFASYLFKTPTLIHIFMRHSQGLVSDTWNLKYEHFAKIKVFAPCVAEQQKIAQVLSTADAEITNLQAQLAKLKLEKKALMQQLLTGQRHVKPDADAAV